MSDRVWRTWWIFLTPDKGADNAFRAEPVNKLGEVHVIEADAVRSLVKALEKVNHALANASEWHVSDPEDSEMDRDSQIGNWIEKALDEVKEALASLPPELLE